MNKPFLADEVLNVMTAGVVITDHAKGLGDISLADRAAAIWDRAFSPDVLDWLDGLASENLPEGRVLVQPSAARGSLELICEKSGTPAGAHRDALIEDAAMLVEHFLEAVPAPWIRIRLDVVTGNACRRFHIDAVKARLICTYRGTGTQYGNASDGVTPDHIHTVPTGAPVILRGTKWPETPEANLRHRSPPIEGSGETRLLLVVDPIFDPEDEA